jgi:lipopolysaccharide exporter
MKVLGFLGASGGFGRSVAMLATGTAVSQLVGLIALPLLTRLYNPLEFGGAAVFAGIVGLIVVVASLRYELAIPLPMRDGAAFHLVSIAFLSVITVSIAAGVAYFFASYFWEQNTGLSNEMFLLLLVVGTLTAGLYNVANYWAVRKKRFGVISWTRIQQGIAGTGAQIAFGFAGAGVVGMVVGQIIGQCAGLSRLIVGLIKDRRNSKVGAFQPRRASWAAKRYRRFPLYDSAASLLNVASSQAPILLFAALFSPVLAGFYALAVRLVSAPNGLVGKAISQVLLPRIVEARRSAETAKLVERLINILGWLSFMPFTIVALTAPEIVPTAFGSQWAPAASVIAWTSIWAAWQFVTSPLSTAMTGLEALRLHTVVQLVLFVLRVGAILIGAAVQSEQVAIIAFTIASIVGYAVYLVAIGWVTEVSVKRITMALLGPLALSAIGASVALGVAEISIIGKYSAIAAILLIWLWCLNHIRKGNSA